MEPLTILAIAIAFLIIGYLLGKAITDLKWKHEKIPKAREDAILRSREVLTGQFSEQIAPYMPGFPYSPTEVRFIGKPVDFIVFKGMDKKEINEVIFLEVKSGNSKLSSHQERLKKTVNDGKVRWEEYRVISADK